MVLSKIIFENGTVKFAKNIIFGKCALYADRKRYSYGDIDEVHVPC